MCNAGVFVPTFQKSLTTGWPHQSLADRFDWHGTNESGPALVKCHRLPFQSELPTRHKAGAEDIA